MKSEIIYDMPETEYHALAGISATQLKIASRDGLASLKRYLDGELPGTRAQREGWLAHMRVNSPADWARVVYPPGSLAEGIKTKDGKPALKPKQTAEYAEKLLQWELEHPHEILVSEEEYLRVDRIASALLDSSCFHECSATEIVVLFPFMGKQAKCRVDGEYRNHDGSYDLYDWKFVAGTRNFASKIFDYRYHMQGAFYRAAYEAVGRQAGRFYLVGIDKETCDPSYTTCAPLSDRAIELGMKECEYWMTQIIHAKQSGIWPGVESPAEWDPPSWYQSPVSQGQQPVWMP